MGPLEGKKVALDSNILIYAVEGFVDWRGVLQRLFDGIDDGRIVGSCSELALPEVLVAPLRLGRSDVVRIYEAMLDPAGPLRVVPVDRGILRRAAEIRVSSGCRLPDAIHLASAVAAGVELFLTNDKRMPEVDGVRTMSLGEL